MTTGSFDLQAVTNDSDVEAVKGFQREVQRMLGQVLAHTVSDAYEAAGVPRLHYLEALFSVRTNSPKPRAFREAVASLP